MSGNGQSNIDMRGAAQNPPPPASGSAPPRGPPGGGNWSDLPKPRGSVFKRIVSGG